MKVHNPFNKPDSILEAGHRFLTEEEVQKAIPADTRYFSSDARWEKFGGVVQPAGIPLANCWNSLTLSTAQPRPNDVFAGLISITK